MVNYYSKPVRRANQAPAPPQPRFLNHGDVIFAPLPQNLSQGGVEFKVRPIVVANKKGAIYKVTSDGRLASPFNFIGIPGTSKDYVVEDRPYVAFTIPPRDITTYTLVDGIRTVSVDDRTPKTSYRLKAAELAEMQQGLDSVLRPEPGFYRRRFFSEKFSEGKMWTIKTHGDDRERQALILLRRGQFFMGDAGDEVVPSTENARTRYTPYLVAVFRAAEQVTNLRGIGWNDVEILAVQERSFIRPVGELQKDSVTSVLNNLRQIVGLKSIEYKRPPVRSVATILNYMGRVVLMTLPR